MTNFSEMLPCDEEVNAEKLADCQSGWDRIEITARLINRILTMVQKTGKITNAQKYEIQRNIQCIYILADDMNPEHLWTPITDEQYEAYAEMTELESLEGYLPD